MSPNFLAQEAMRESGFSSGIVYRQLCNGIGGRKGGKEKGEVGKEKGGRP